MSDSDITFSIDLNSKPFMTYLWSVRLRLWALKYGLWVLTKTADLLEWLAKRV